MPQFQQHVVGYIDDVVDRALTHGLESALEPLGRGANLDAAHDAADIARAIVWCLDIDPHIFCDGWATFSHLDVGKTEGIASECVDLAGNA